QVLPSQPRNCNSVRVVIVFFVTSLTTVLLARLLSLVGWPALGRCFPDRVPVCGSDGLTYDTACHMRQASCRLQRNITVVSYGPCYNGECGSLKSTKCGICLYGSECDEDAEDVGCVCNIDCAGHNSNPVCASDGVSYENPCLVKEASCMKQQRIEVRFLGKCPSDSTKGHSTRVARTFEAERDVIRDLDEPIARDYGMPCPEQFRSFCINGYCEYSGNQQEPACLCEPGYVGRQCESKENMLYVVPDGNNLRYVLIAAVVGAVQLTVTFALVVCVASFYLFQPSQRTLQICSENTTQAARAQSFRFFQLLTS
uniref:Transmembrane protein with EGF-like and two follistatin-like domains 2a n=1 Tax=Eptatretus burgeri TaxID=7764 RepID=A0A8C4Q5B3_EPTBU